MADFAAIATAIATKAGGVAGVRHATHLVPDAVPFTPYVVVLPPNAQSQRPMSQEVIESDFPMHLYLARPGDTGRTLAQVYPYIASFYTAWRTGITLGTASVQESWIVSHELDDMPDYENRYLGIRFVVRVRTRENVSRTS